MSAQFPDYLLTAYWVNYNDRRIRIRAERRCEDKDGLDIIELQFAGIEAYYFEGDNLGTIFGEIVEASLAVFIDEHAEDFDQAFRGHGWPSFWRGSKTETFDYLDGHSMKIFRLDTDYGMRGWILARAFEAIDKLA